MPDFPDDLATEVLFDADIALLPPEATGAGPLGRRLIFIVRGGTFQGPRLHGNFRPGGGDWYLALANGAGELDVRGTLETHDGALIMVAYHGVIVAGDDVTQRALSGEDVSTR